MTSHPPRPRSPAVARAWSKYDATVCRSRILKCFRRDQHDENDVVREKCRVVKGEQDERDCTLEDDRQSIEEQGGCGLLHDGDVEEAIHHLGCALLREGSNVGPDEAVNGIVRRTNEEPLLKRLDDLVLQRT